MADESNRSQFAHYLLAISKSALRLRRIWNPNPMLAHPELITTDSKWVARLLRFSSSLRRKFRPSNSFQCACAKMPTFPNPQLSSELLEADYPSQRSWRAFTGFRRVKNPQKATHLVPGTQFFVWCCPNCSLPNRWSIWSPPLLYPGLTSWFRLENLKAWSFQIQKSLLIR